MDTILNYKYLGTSRQAQKTCAQMTTDAMASIMHAGVPQSTMMINADELDTGDHALYPVTHESEDSEDCKMTAASMYANK